MRSGYSSQSTPSTPNKGTASSATDAYPFVAGDKVAWMNSQSYRRRIGIVTQIRYTLGVLHVVDFQTGELHLVPTQSAVLIHGYLHIDTPQQERF